MATPLLLLPHHYGPDTQDVWREALRRKWRIERIGSAKIDIEPKCLGHSPIKYYGNILHQEQCGGALPIKFLPIDITNLPRLREFTGRYIELLRARDIPQPIRETLVFLKCPGVKWIESRIYKQGEYFDCKPDDFIYRQEPIEIIDEIRCFVVDGVIQAASWYRINKEFIPEELIDIGIFKHLQSLTTGIWAAAKWPRGIVFDFGRLRNGRWIFIECNESWASGLYGCNPSGVFESIIASQE